MRFRHLKTSRKLLFIYSFENIFTKIKNIAYNQTSSQEVLNDWIASPTHYENLITKKATEI